MSMRPEQIKDKVNASLRDLVILSDIVDIKDFMHNGLARTRLHLCLEHAVAVKIWTHDTDNLIIFTPNDNWPYMSCSIIGCKKHAVVQTILNVLIQENQEYIDVKV